MSDKADELYRQYEADKLLVDADLTLTQAAREQVMTRLTDEFLEAEQAAGIRWEPVGGFEVEAKEAGYGFSAGGKWFGT